MRPLHLLFSLSLLAGFVAKSHLKPSAAAPPWKVAVLYWSMNIPGQVAMRRGLETELQRINAEAARTGGRSIALEASVAGDGEAGVERQIGQFEALVRQRPDAIIVQPTDIAALVAPLKQANLLKIPVVAYDQYIMDGRLEAYRTSDNRQAGYLDGEYIASLFPDSHRIRLVLVDYPRVSSTVERVDGFLDALSDRKQPYQVEGRFEAVEPVSGRAAGMEILKTFPKPHSIDVVFTVNDGGGLAVVDALAGAGRTEIKVASIDGDPASVRNIQAGRLTVVDAAQFCGPLGAEALKAAHAVLLGQRPPLHALVPTFPVTAGTAAQYPGWQGPIPIRLNLPWPSKYAPWQGKLRVVLPAAPASRPPSPPKEAR